MDRKERRKIANSQWKKQNKTVSSKWKKEDKKISWVDFWRKFTKEEK